MWKWHVELPNTDEWRTFSSLWQCYEFLKETYNLEHTDCDTDLVHCKVKVPQFQESRDAYKAAKAKDCARWGCE